MKRALTAEPVSRCTNRHRLDLSEPPPKVDRKVARGNSTPVTAASVSVLDGTLDGSGADSDDSVGRRTCQAYAQHDGITGGPKHD